MKRFAYARVSRIDQNPQLQIDALEKAGYDELFTEKASGKDLNRPEFIRMYEKLRPGDEVIVWKLDRLGRNFKDLINLLDDWEKQGIKLTLLTEGYNTGTREGKMFLHMLALVADYERDRLRERTLAGLESARKKGHFGGKRPRLKPDKVEEMKKLYNEHNISVDALCKMFGIARSTFFKYMARETSD